MFCETNKLVYAYHPSIISCSVMVPASFCAIALSIFAKYSAFLFIRSSSVYSRSDTITTFSSFGRDIINTSPLNTRSHMFLKSYLYCCTLYRHHTSHLQFEIILFLISFLIPFLIFIIILFLPKTSQSPIHPLSIQKHAPMMDVSLIKYNLI